MGCKGGVELGWIDRADAARFFLGDEVG